MERDFLIPLYGGSLIGLAGVLMLLFNGRVLGVSGILGGLFETVKSDFSWRLAFLAGIFSGGFLIQLLNPQAFSFALDRSTLSIAIAGLLVGTGTRMANGCTSGHGVCGISRLSPRSIAATLTFMGAGIFIVTVINRFFGGSI